MQFCVYPDTQINITNWLVIVAQAPGSREGKGRQGLGPHPDAAVVR
jgi:hypothetical protein